VGLVGRWREKGEKLVWMCKVSGLSILMVVFCHKPRAPLPNFALPREAIREVSCTNRLETYKSSQITLATSEFS
jgi:hypothetical protein